MSDVRRNEHIDMEQDDMSVSFNRQIQRPTDETTDLQTLAISGSQWNFRTVLKVGPKQSNQQEEADVQSRHDVCLYNRENVGSQSQSDSREELDINSSNKVLVSGSKESFLVSKIVSSEGVANDQQRGVLHYYQPSNNQDDFLLITGKTDQWPMILDKEYIERIKSFMHPNWPSELNAKVMATAGMKYKGPSPGRDGGLVYDMVECVVCGKTMYDFKPDEDPLAEHMMLHPECPRFQQY